MARRRFPVHLLGPRSVGKTDSFPDCSDCLRGLREGLSEPRLDRARRAAVGLLARLAAHYGIAPVRLSLLDRPRPHHTRGARTDELHGDYLPPNRIRVFARTAKRRQRVAFLTLLDTLLHEFLHHYDLQYLRLEDSVHSERFYQRLGSLSRLVRGNRPYARPLKFGFLAAASQEAASRRSPGGEPEQPYLPF